jgi:PHD/YefM family antitoxin component YafN of YafNO toxin-antitoxin module
MKSIPTTTLRDNMADALESISSTEKYMLVTKKGKPVSALVNLDYFEDLLASSSDKYLLSVQEARADYVAGKQKNHEDVFGSL